MNKQTLRENYSELGKEVFDRLEAICNDYDFLLCTMNDLNTDYKAQKMLNFLNYTKTTDTDVIIPYTLKIQQGLDYFVNGMAIAFNSVYRKASENKNSKDEAKILRELDTKQRQILNLFEEQKFVTTKDIADFFKFSPRSARALALEWINTGFLIAVGEGKKRKYQLNEKYENIL